MIQKLYFETLAPDWPPERQHIEDGYRSLTFPFDEVPLPQLFIEEQWTFADLAGYIKTWSAV